jgi:cell division transport system ATP-binding protein
MSPFSDVFVVYAFVAMQMRCKCNNYFCITQKNIIFAFITQNNTMTMEQYHSDSQAVIELKGVSIYHGESHKHSEDNDLVLSGVDLTVNDGEFVYLIGRVGSGKSSMLKALYAEVDIHEGEASVVGFNLRALKRKQIPMLRRSMGIVFQDFQLLTDRNVFDNLYDVMRATGWKSEEDIRCRIDEVLNLVNLSHKSYKMPFELSGGEQQRLAIARALLNKPRLILADEPTGNLDVRTADEIMVIFKQITQSGCAVVMSTHNISLIEQFPSRTILFANGHITEVDVKGE